ncbi:hypothetical protein ACTWP9_05390 [Streptomyces sp. 3N207]
MKTVAVTATNIPTGQERKRRSAMSAIDSSRCRLAYVHSAGPATYATAKPVVGQATSWGTS